MIISKSKYHDWWSFGFAASSYCPDYTTSADSDSSFCHHMLHATSRPLEELVCCSAWASEQTVMAGACSNCGALVCVVVPGAAVVAGRGLRRGDGEGPHCDPGQDGGFSAGDGQPQADLYPQNPCECFPPCSWFPPSSVPSSSLLSSSFTSCESGGAFRIKG